MWLLVGGDSEIGSAAYRKPEGGRAAGGARPRAGPTAPPPSGRFSTSPQPLDRWEPPPGTRAACIFAAVARLAACADDPAGTANINVTQTLALTERLLERGIARRVPVDQPGVRRHAPPTCRPMRRPIRPANTAGRRPRAEARLREHMARGAPVSILRLAKVVSTNMPLIHGWVDALAAGQPIRAFHDMTMAPTPTDLVVAAIAALMEERATGMFQLTGPQDVLYSDVAAPCRRRGRRRPAAWSRR